MPSPIASPTPAPQVRTVESSVPARDEPVRFSSGLNGATFGYGTMAAGSAAGGTGAAQSMSAGSKSEAAPKLSRPPSLGEADPCRGFFPARATVDRGEVALSVRIEADGRVRSVAVSREAPSAQGFGAAARECLLSKHFSPALDLSGVAVSVLSPVTVRFSR